ncbi:DUF1835 domain-containing protein [Pontimicrobium sp. IMCC45349]|uniref:DUF1835 domain-containing protein n=1 Tax=Pontimicrobium sp. IMCC45349 TaxID=3391574 RepID=UPI0039A3A83E
MNNVLNITNGSNLTERLNELNVSGDFLTWQEMLCEGPTHETIDSTEFLSMRKTFLESYYNIEIDEYEFKNEIDKLNNTQNYNKIILWFEYDLFCHINLIAVISLLKQKGINKPLYLVCSGRVKGEKELKGLSELNDDELLLHLKNKVLLSKSDIEMATTLWGIYCGKNHNLLKPFIVETSSFKYLNSCLKAHLKRFPDSQNGLGRLELHILETINSNTVKSRHHLLGYILNYQGYYGFGDLQIKRMIDKLSMFYNETDEQIKLNRKGHEVLLNKHNFSVELNNDLAYGGVNRLDFQFNKKENKLIKTIINAY